MTRITTSRPFQVALAAVAAVAGVAVMVALLGPRFGIGDASADLGIFAPVAGRIVYGDASGIWGVDPSWSTGRTTDPAPKVQLSSETGTPLAWSSDGTQLLIDRKDAGEGGLVILDADGSETPVTGGSSLAAISPDGSRVAFVGATPTEEECCPSWALYVVDAEGGPPELLVEGQAIIRGPTFSPDGTQIAYIDGAGDNGHHVWVIGTDGSGAHEILLKNCACHVRGLAWSPAGDRIALGLDGSDEGIWTFAPDGSDLTRVIVGGVFPHWSPDGSQIAYQIACLADHCPLAISDADGSNERAFVNFFFVGPWHPGTLP